jgi:hypothetical protein
MCRVSFSVISVYYQTCSSKNCKDSFLGEHEIVIAHRNGNRMTISFQKLFCSKSNDSYPPEAAEAAT